MYNRQRGFVPLITKLLGIIILVYPYFVVIINALSKLLSNHTPIDIVITIVAATAVLAFPTWLGLLLVNMFPSVRVINDGIKYMSISFIKGIIKWNEIEDALLFENGYIAIAFQRPGLFLLNGTYFNILYGKLIRHESATLFISPGTIGRDEILTAIHSNSTVKKLKKSLLAIHESGEP